MLKYIDSNIVFQEIPDEVTLAVNLSGCPCRCPGCHSKYLWSDNGEPLDGETLDGLIDKQNGRVSCLALLGGDAAPAEVDSLLAGVRKRHPKLHTAWWSGRTIPSPLVSLSNLDYLKLGPYLAHLGPLKSRHTNQRLYKVAGGTLHDITSRFWR